MRAALRLLATGLLLAGPGGWAQHRIFLDFTLQEDASLAIATGEQTSIIAGAPQTSVGGVGPGGTRGKLPVSLRIHRLIPSVCTAGEEIVYEVELQNDDAGGLRVPTTTLNYPTDADHVPVGYRKLSLGLMVDRPDTGPAFLGTVSVASGSDVIDGTLGTVKPGERVLLRARGQCPIGNMIVGSASSRGGTVVPVSAELRLWNRPDASEGAVQSTKVDLTVMR